jgi:hypothetical protein
MHHKRGNPVNFVLKALSFSELGVVKLKGKLFDETLAISDLVGVGVGQARLGSLQSVLF